MTASPKRALENSIETGLRHVARELRASLEPIILEVAGPVPRPSRLAQRLEIDKSLASRLSRAFRREDSLEFMHLLPAPTGLRIFLAGAAEAQVDARLCQQAENSVDQFQALIDTTPGGRATLDAAISARSEEARNRNERSAKQAVYRGMSYLLGLHCETIVTSFIIQPSEDGDGVDAIDLHQRIGLRRLRPSAPVGIFSLRLHPPSEGGTPAPQVRTLDGGPASDVESHLLPDFSSAPLPEMEALHNGTQTTIVLSGEDPKMEAPMTLTSAVVISNVMQRYRTEGCEDEWRGYLLHYPCKTVIRDVFIRDDLYVGSVPEITFHIPTPKGLETVRHPSPFKTLNTLDLSIPIENLGRGLEQLAPREVPTYPLLVRQVFERTGWDASRFRGYRARVIYPVPMVFMTWWFPLPKAPTS
jgi:hypothetical protein